MESPVKAMLFGAAAYACVDALMQTLSSATGQDGDEGPWMTDMAVDTRDGTLWL